MSFDFGISEAVDPLRLRLLVEVRPTRLERYFAAKTSTLPPVMKDQLEVWLKVLTEGSHQAPRQTPRDPQTIRVHILGIEPIIHGWAEAGFQSFTEVTRADITTALEGTGGRRHIAGNGLKSLFTTLKARRLVFANPTRGMKASPKATTIPLALDAAVIRGGAELPGACGRPRGCLGRLPRPDRSAGP